MINNYPHGVDLSTWNNVDDYTGLGIEFAIVKATQGKSVTGSYKNFTDSKFFTHLEELYKAGVKCGAYHYLTAVNKAEAEEEAEYFCDTLDKVKDNIKLWAVADVEEKKFLPLDDKKLLTDIVKSFCGVVEARGYKPMVYTNPSFLNSYMKNLAEYDLWLALWRDVNNLPSQTTYPNLKVWQYTDNGVIPGISGGVDCNLGFFNEDDFSENNKEKDEEITYETFREYMDKYRAEMRTTTPASWSADARKWAQDSGLFSGDGSGNFMWQDFITREQTAALLFRMSKK
jgi:GH25 family lysozyme M1 (1,4-beta-N-acetylmuramidase)